MANWNENNNSAILEYPFDFDRYIEERLREIDKLDERRFAKTVLLEGLGRVIGCTEKKYRELEQRIYKEIEMESNQYETVMTIVRRNHYDPTNGTLYPVIPEDLDEKKQAEALSADGMLCLGTVFLELNQAGIKQMTGMKKFEGSVSIKGETRSAEFFIRPAGRYRDMMECLYQVFQDNRIPWETVNTGYLDKFYDVYMDASSLRSMEDVIPGTLVLADTDIRFGEFGEHVLYERIPLWNLDWVTFDSADFMLPCVSGIYFEHEFSLEDQEEKDGYLIRSNEDIPEIRHETGRIVIKSQAETFEGWKALRIIRRETVRSLDYTEPIVSNHKRDTFFRRFSSHGSVQLMTKTDLFRRIMELDIRDYIEAVGYEIRDNARDYPASEGMNWFVRDELFPMESRKVLLLKFEEKQKGSYLSDSMIRFVISQMQLEISEYRCVGVMA